MHLRRRLVYSSDEIATAVRRLAAEISSAHEGKELIFLVVLKGAFFFAADLARELTIPVVLDFVKIASYSGTETTGKVVITKQPDINLSGKHVVVIEDIIDTGLSLAFLLDELRTRRPATLQVCTLINKTSRRRIELTPDFVGLDCRDGFLIGYGLDFDERYRELREIYEIEQ